MLGLDAIDDNQSRVVFKCIPKCDLPPPPIHCPKVDSWNTSKYMNPSSSLLHGYNSPMIDVVGCSLLFMKTKMAWAGSNFMCLRMMNMNCASVSSCGTMNLFFFKGCTACSLSLHSTTMGMRSGCCFKMTAAFNLRSSNGTFLRYFPVMFAILWY